MAGGGFLGPRRGMMGGGGAGGGSLKMMRVGGRGVAVGGGGAATTANSPTSKPRSRCSSPTRAHYQKPLTSSTPSDIINNSSNSSSKGGFTSGYYGLDSPFSPYYGWPAAFSGEEYEWVSYDGGSEEEEVHDVSEEEMPPPFLLPPRDEGFLGPASPEEVYSTVSALAQVFGTSSYTQLVRDKYAYSADAADQSPVRMLRRVASVGAESDWLEPSPNLANTRMSRSFGSGRGYDVFHQLQTHPVVKEIVISLSSDKAVWDAVLNNEAVRELRQTYSSDAKKMDYSDANVSPPSLEDSPESAGKTNPALKVIVWMLDSTRAKFVDIFETLSKLVNDLLKQTEEAKTAAGPPEPNQPDQFEKIMSTSFQLSILVILIVAIARSLKARP